jgi:hypothetical protein
MSKNKNKDNSSLSTLAVDNDSNNENGTLSQVQKCGSVGGREVNVKIKKEKIIFFNRLMYPTKLAQQNNTFGNHEENDRTKIYYCAV